MALPAFFMLVIFDRVSHLCPGWPGLDPPFCDSYVVRITDTTMISFFFFFSMVKMGSHKLFDQVVLKPQSS
jgi:hypothetical protein